MIMTLFWNLKGLKSLYLTINLLKSIFGFHHLKKSNVLKKFLGGVDLEINLRTILLFLEVLIKLFLIFIE